jgi:hypothetical protein
MPLPALRTTGPAGVRNVGVVAERSHLRFAYRAAIYLPY